MANLKALAQMLIEHPSDIEVLERFHAELDRMDDIIHQMAEEASEHDD